MIKNNDSFDHFLITRFNLRTFSPEIVIRDNANLAISDEWLSHRFELFEKLCFPSVNNQTNQNFTWLVFFDEETPQLYKSKIENLTAISNLFRPFFLDHKVDFNQQLIEIIKQLSFRKKHLITTRLDNDDAIHRDFISTVQSFYNPAITKTLVDIRNGFQVTILDNNYEIRNYQPKFNHFLSMIEGYDNFATVFDRIHPAWESPDTPCLVYNDKKLWIEFIHGKNNLCHTRHYLKRLCSVKHHEFGIAEKIKDNPNKVIYSNSIKLVLGLARRFSQNKVQK